MSEPNKTREIAVQVALNLHPISVEDLLASAKQIEEYLTGDEIAELRAQIAPFDHDGDGRIGGSKKRSKDVA